MSEAMLPCEITLHAGQIDEEGRKIASFIWPAELGDLLIPTKWLLQSSPAVPGAAVDAPAMTTAAESDLVKLQRLHDEAIKARARRAVAATDASPIGELLLLCKAHDEAESAFTTAAQALADKVRELEAEKLQIQLGWADEQCAHEQLKERCEQYKGQIEAGADRIARLQASNAEMRKVVDAARHMPRATPAPGGCSTVHMIGIEAATIWLLDKALTEYDRASAATGDGEEQWVTR